MKNGFTLIEVLGSIFILSLLVVVSSQISYGNFNKMKKARVLEKISYLLESKMSEIESQYKNDNISSLPQNDNGDFENEKDYTWSYTTNTMQLPSSLILLSMQGLDQSQNNIQVIDIVRDVLSKAIVELKLTVTYNKGKKPAKYSLTSYFVNYFVVPEELRATVSNLIPGAGAIPEGFGDQGL